MMKTILSILIVLCGLNNTIAAQLLSLKSSPIEAKNITRSSDGRIRLNGNTRLRYPVDVARCAGKGTLILALEPDRAPGEKKDEPEILFQLGGLHWMPNSLTIVREADGRIDAIFFSGKRVFCQYPASSLKKGEINVFVVTWDGRKVSCQLNESAPQKREFPGKLVVPRDMLTLGSISTREEKFFPKWNFHGEIAGFELHDKALSPEEITGKIRLFRPRTQVSVVPVSSERLEGSRLTAEFDKQGSPLKLTLHNKTGKDTILPLADGNFWETQAFDKTFAPRNAQLLSMCKKSGDDGVSLETRHAIGKEDYIITTRYSIRSDAPEQLRMNTQVEAKNPNRHVFRMHFSRLHALPVRRDAWFVQAFRCGYLWNTTKITHSERPAPGHMWMQMSGYYNPDFGVMLHCEDKDGFLKFNYFGKNKNGIFAGWRENMVLEGNKPYTMPYDYVVTLYGAGTDFHNFTDTYAKWARRQDWAKTTAKEKLALRPHLRKHIFNGVIKICGYEGMGNGYYIPYDKKQKIGRMSMSYAQAAENMQKFENTYQIAPGYRFDGWYGVHDVGYPDLLPVAERIGGMNGLQKFFDFSNKNKMPIDYYVNPANYDEDAPSYRIWKSIRDSKMEPGAHSFWGASRLRWVSGKFMIEDTVPVLQKLNKMGLYGGIFFDQLGGSSPFLDFNDNAGYEYYGRDSSHKGQRAAFHAYRQKFPQFSLGTEDGQEMMLADFDFTEAYARGNLNYEEQNRIDGGKSFLPLNELVYGDLFFNLMGIDGNSRLTHDARRAVRVLFAISQGCSMRGELEYIPVRHAEFERNDVIGEFADQRMLRHEILSSGCRASLYRNGAILSNTEGEKQDVTLKTSIGLLEVKDLRPHGFVIINGNGKFQMWGAKEILLDGKLVARVSNPDSIITLNRRGIHLASYGFVGIRNDGKAYAFYDKKPWTLTIPGICGKNLMRFPGNTPVKCRRTATGAATFDAPGSEMSIWIR